MSLTDLKMCPDCKGLGRTVRKYPSWWITGWGRCPTCKGIGMVER